MKNIITNIRLGKLMQYLRNLGVHMCARELVRTGNSRCRV
jgi:hypothetical protein